MIAGMKKVHILLLEKEKSQGLRALRRLGVVHLEPVAGRGQDHDETARQLAVVERALGAVPEPKEKSAAAPQTPAAEQAGIEAARQTTALMEEARSLQEDLAGLVKEYERISDYGDFRPADVDALAAAGRRLRLFECPASRLETLAGTLSYVRIVAPKGIARIAVLGDPEGEISPELAEIQLPAASPSMLRERIGASEARDAAIRAEMAGMTAHRPAMIAARDRLAQDLAFETVRSGMESQGPVAYLSGYVPAQELPRLQKEAVSHAWGLLADDPSPADLPPTKVETSAVVRIISPVFQFLGTVPHYREYDISAWFLVFFGLYFAMIFGDGGYGLIMLVGGLIGAVKAKRAGKRIPDALRLLLVLAVMTIAWGTVTSNFFAIPVERLPPFIRALAIPAIQSGNPMADTNVKIFCFVVGAVQLAIAHIKNIVRDFPNPKFLAQVGNLAMVVGMFMAVLNLVIDPARFPIPTWALACVGGGFLLVFSFGNWEGNLIKSILAGLKGIIPTFLGTVSVFADIVSYIRLWAVGLAGLAISQTVNSMAGGMFGEPAGRILAFAIGAVMGCILLGAGHALNLVMSVLSVVVHGIRLNMLEFSGHLGMEWSGYRYDPFRETVREDSSN